MGQTQKTLAIFGAVFFAAACCLMLSIIPAYAATTPQMTAQDRNYVRLGLIMGTAATKDTVDRANEATAKAYRALDASRREITDAEKRADAAEQKAAKSKGETIAARADAKKARAEIATMKASQLAREEAFLSERRSQDAQFAAAEKAFREQIRGLFERNDPQILDAIARYNQGDVSALDALDEYTNALAAARTAATRVANGELFRGRAAVWSDAADKGDKTVAQALAKWQEAAAVDPENFWQWENIAELAAQNENGTLELIAANELWRLAKSDEERARASRVCSYQIRNDDQKYCEGSWTSEQYVEEAVRLRRKDKSAMLCAARSFGSDAARKEKFCTGNWVRLEFVEENKQYHKQERWADFVSTDGYDDFGLISDLQYLADFRKDSGQRQALLSEAVELSKELKERLPENVSYELKYISLLAAIGVPMTNPKEIADARQLFERAVLIARQNLGSVDIHFNHRTAETSATKAI